MSTPSDSQMGTTPRLQARVESCNGAPHVILEGELDLATVGVAEEAMKRVDADAKTLILDLRKLRFLDSSGLRLILTLADAPEAGPEKVYVVRGPAQVDRVFELTGAGERLNLVDDPSLIDQI